MSSNQGFFVDKHAKLSPHFTFSELILSRNYPDIPNFPSVKKTYTLIALCDSILEPIRVKWGRIAIDSGYRSPSLNEAVGGSPRSQHLKAEAADGVPLDAKLGAVYRWIVSESGIMYGQACIYPSRGFFHISLPDDVRKKQAFVSLIKGQYIPYGNKLA